MGPVPVTVGIDVAKATLGWATHCRSALYMPTLAAIRFNHDIRTFYQRLVANGRPKQLAVIACQRKLLTILNAITKQHRHWEPIQAATA